MTHDLPIFHTHHYAGQMKKVRNIRVKHER